MSVIMISLISIKEIIKNVFFYPRETWIFLSFLGISRLTIRLTYFFRKHPYEAVKISNYLTAYQIAAHFYRPVFGQIYTPETLYFTAKKASPDYTREASYLLGYQDSNLEMTESESDSKQPLIPLFKAFLVIHLWSGPFRDPFHLPQGKFYHITPLKSKPFHALCPSYIGRFFHHRNTLSSVFTSFAKKNTIIKM